MKKRNLTSVNSDLTKIEKALEKALVPLKPGDALFARLESQVRDLAVQPFSKPFASPTFDRQQIKFAGLAGVFMVLMTLAVGFRTAGTILGALTLMNGVSKQVKTKKAPPLTPAV